MQIKTFEGSFYEIGQQIGAIYQTIGVQDQRMPVNPELLRNQLAMYEQHYPEFLEEIRGVAAGGRFDPQLAIQSAVTGELFFFQNMMGMGRACTIFGLKQGGQLLAGRNYDWLPLPKDLFEVYRVNNSARHAFFAATDYGIVDPAMSAPQYRSYLPEDVINDQGLFVGITFSFVDQWAYGILVKLLAETCATLDEALALFERVPACCPKNYFIADRFGNMAVVEHGVKKFKVVYPQDGILIQTNHLLDPDLAQEDTVLQKMPFHNTYIRYYETLQRIQLQRENFNMDSIGWVLNAPGTYTLQDFPDIRTIWTLALDMTGRKYQVYWDLFGEKQSMELKF
ncbi:MAG: hypothetical protein PWQ55_1317 [Chloroflexota bacterium]|nr:hypothetical protein [Chloroflexota bacterium]